MSVVGTVVELPDKIVRGAFTLSKYTFRAADGTVKRFWTLTKELADGTWQFRSSGSMAELRPKLCEEIIGLHKKIAERGRERAQAILKEPVGQERPVTIKGWNASDDAATARRPEHPKYRHHVVGIWADAKPPMPHSLVRFPEWQPDPRQCQIQPIDGGMKPDPWSPQRYVVAVRIPDERGLGSLVGSAYSPSEAHQIAKELESQRLTRLNGFRPEPVEKPEPLKVSKREWAVVRVVQSHSRGAILEVVSVHGNRGVAEFMAKLRKDTAVFPRSFEAGQAQKQQHFRVGSTEGFEKDPNARKINRLVEKDRGRERIHVPPIAHPAAMEKKEWESIRNWKQIAKGPKVTGNSRSPNEVRPEGRAMPKELLRPESRSPKQKQRIEWTWG